MIYECTTNKENIHDPTNSQHLKEITNTPNCYRNKKNQYITPTKNNQAPSHLSCFTKETEVNSKEQQYKLLTASIEKITTFRNTSNKKSETEDPINDILELFVGILNEKYIKLENEICEKYKESDKKLNDKFNHIKEELEKLCNESIEIECNQKHSKTNEFISQIGKLKSVEYKIQNIEEKLENFHKKLNSLNELTFYLREFKSTEYQLLENKLKDIEEKLREQYKVINNLTSQIETQSKLEKTLQEKIYQIKNMYNTIAIMLVILSLIFIIYMILNNNKNCTVQNQEDEIEALLF